MYVLFLDYIAVILKYSHYNNMKKQLRTVHDWLHASVLSDQHFYTEHVYYEPPSLIQNDSGWNAVLDGS